MTFIFHVYKVESENSRIKCPRVPKPSQSGPIQPIQIWLPPWSRPWLQPWCSCHWFPNTLLTIPLQHFLSSCSSHCLASPTSPPGTPLPGTCPGEPQTPLASWPKRPWLILTSHSALILHCLRVLLSRVSIPRLIDFRLLWGKDYVFSCLCFLLLRPNTGSQPNTNWIIHKWRFPCSS